MSDEPENVVLVHLRRIDTKLDQLRSDMAEIKHRQTTLEIQVGSFIATEQSHFGHTMARFDQMERRLAHIERRLDLVDEPTS